MDMAWTNTFGGEKNQEKEKEGGVSNRFCSAYIGMKIPVYIEY